MKRKTSLRSEHFQMKSSFYLALVLLPLNGLLIARLQYFLLDSHDNLLATAGTATLLVFLYFLFSPWLEYVYDRNVRATYESSIPKQHKERFRGLTEIVNNAYYSDAFLSHMKLGKTALTKLPIYITAKYELIKHALLMGVHLGVFYYLLPQLFPVVLVLLGLSFFAKYRLYRERVDFQLVHVEEDRVAEYFRNVLLNPNAMHDIKIFGAEDLIAEHSISAFESGLKKRYRLRRKNALGYPLVKAISVLAMGVTLFGITNGTVLGVALGAANDGLGTNVDFGVNLPTLVVAMTAVWGIVTQMEPICDRYLEYKEAKTLLEKREAQELVLPRYSDDGVVIERIEEIRFERVSFAYEDGRSILKNLNFTWTIRENIANAADAPHVANAANAADIANSGISLIGENGAGKTTLIKLLLGINTPTSGTIYVNGMPLREINSRSYLRCFGFCMQDFVIFSDELQNNLVFGETDRKRALDRALHARCSENAATADEIKRMLDFVEQLPNGIYTHIGEIYEDGVMLSGGQEQRVALARALVEGAENSDGLSDGGRIFVLDEPTSALDPEMEHEIFKVFQRLVCTNPVFLITHRIGYAGLCGRILVMKDGAIVEDGDHETLMRRNGAYAKMYAAQSQMYDDRMEISKANDADACLF